MNFFVTFTEQEFKKQAENPDISTEFISTKELKEYRKQPRSNSHSQYVAASHCGDELHRRAHLENAAKYGSPEAQNELGLDYFEKKDYAMSLRCYTLSAQQGFFKALYNLGNMYSSGQGVEKDEKKAFKYYRQAANRGSILAEFNVGIAYKYGHGCKPNPVRSFRSFRRSAWKYKASMFNLGLCYLNGSGTKKDVFAACNLFRRLAEQMYSCGQLAYGYCLLHGYGVEKNVAAGKEFIKKSNMTVETMEKLLN